MSQKFDGDSPSRSLSQRGRRASFEAMVLIDPEDRFDFLWPEERSGDSGADDVAAEGFDEEMAQAQGPVPRQSSNFILSESMEHVLPAQNDCKSRLRSIAIQWGLLVSFVLSYATQFTSRSLSREDGEFRYSVGSLLLISTVINLIFGLLGTRLAGTPMRSCFDLRQIVLWIPATVLTVADLILKFAVLEFLPPTAAALLQQAKLITVAMASACVFGKRYSSIEVMSLAVILIIMLLYSIDDGNHVNDSSVQISSRYLRGLLLQAVEIVVATVLAVAKEFTMKNPRADRVPFPCMQVRSSIVMIPILILYFITDESIKAHRMDWGFPTFFNGWTWKVGIVVIVSFINVWLGNLVQLMMDSVARRVASAMAIPVVFLEMLALQPSTEIGNSSAHEIFVKVCSLLAIIMTIANFAISSRFARKHRDLKGRLSQEETMTQMATTAPGGSPSSASSSSTIRASSEGSSIRASSKASSNIDGGSKEPPSGLDRS